MSLSAYPFPPPVGVMEQSFELQRVDFLAPEARGRIGGVTAGFPLWLTRIRLAALDETNTDKWRAFVASLRGSQRLFYGREYLRTMPRQYKSGFPGGFTGAASSWSQTIDANGYAVLTLNGLYSTLALKAGDYVDFRWGTYQRAMVRLVEDATASAGTLSATIEPAVPNVVPSGAVAHLDNPACLMRLLSDTEVGTVALRGAMDSGTMIAIQDLLP